MAASVKLASLPDFARDYILSHIFWRTTFCDEVRRAVESVPGRVSALVEPGFQGDLSKLPEGHDFNWGGFAKPLAELGPIASTVSEWMSSVPDRWLVLLDGLGGPKSPIRPGKDEGASLILVDGQAVVVIPLRDADTIERLIRHHLEPYAGSFGIMAEGRPSTAGSDTPTEVAWMAARRPSAILLEAFDGEGYMIWEPEARPISASW